MKIYFLGFLVVFLVFFTGLSLAVVHPLYPSFSSASSGFVFNNTTRLISATDAAVYSVGYFSVNGSAWQSFIFSGTAYNGNVNWLSGSSSYTLPVFGVGEHYIIVYSCAYVNNNWDCHGNKWQLIVVSHNINDTVNGTNSSSCSDNCSSLDYQCGTQTICGSSINCGSCSSGYSCNSSGKCILNCTAHNSSGCYNSDVYWYDSCGVLEGVRYDCNSTQTCSNAACVNSQPGTCGGATCASDEYCSNNVCLLSVAGHTYFVATWGNDSNPGNFSHPWYSWDKGLSADVLEPGDIVYFRGGTWQPTAWWDPDFNAFAANRPNKPGLWGVPGKSGTPENYIKYWNYPGELPILDGSRFNVPIGEHYNSGIGLYRVSYLYFKGLVITNINQNREGVEAGGFGAYETSNLIFENCVAHDIEGAGFSVLQGGLGLPDITKFINCDSYDNVNLYVRMEGNPYGESAGGIADGFKFDNNIGSYVNFTGCRAWGNSDDAFDVSGSVTMVIDHCWAYDGGRLAGDGNGIKFGFVRDDTYDIIMTVTNCIAADNRAFGFTEANGGDITYHFFNSNIFNNIAYNNNQGFGQANNYASGEIKSNTYRNNIAYDNTVIDALLQFEVESNNTWRRRSSDGWAENNLAYTVTDIDFVSLDASQLTRPRKADGSLPDITFGNLTPSSDLIDGGTVVSGYHCETAGEHPGENCRVWYGNAPDLGPFETNY